MAYLFPLLIFSGLAGGLVLLGLGSISKLRGVRKPVTAAWLLLQALIWFVIPSTSRWVLSTWSPGSLLSGWVIVDMQPEIWWLGFIMALTMSGRMWGETAERREHLPLSGVLLILFLITTWLTISSGSLLMTLIAWGINDVVWCVASLMSGGDGERVVIGTAILGLSSLLLWAVSLFLLQAGDSSLWWLIQPSDSILTLLILAAVIRIGLYPFHIVLDNGSTEEHTLGAIYSLGPLAGIGLLFRILKFPGIQIPTWLVIWALISAAWCSIRACVTKNRAALLWVSYAVLQLIVAASIATMNTHLLFDGVAVWLGCHTLLMMARGSTSVPWSWPAWLAGLFMLASPPSLLLNVYDNILLNVPLYASGIALLTLVLSFIALMMSLRGNFWSVNIPWPSHTISHVIGYVFPIVCIVATTIRFGVGMPTWLLFIVWIGVISLAGVLFIYGRIFQRAWDRLYPILEVFDGQWFYHAIWQGSVNVLNFVRVIADVIEGRGSLLWSLLILLLVMLVVSSR
jgi:hypothetical protein